MQSAPYASKQLLRSCYLYSRQFQTSSKANGGVPNWRPTDHDYQFFDANKADYFFGVESWKGWEWKFPALVWGTVLSATIISFAGEYWWHLKNGSEWQWGKQKAIEE